MRQRIENHLLITCDDVDLSEISDMEVYVEQGDLFFQYVPKVLSAHEMLVVVPVEDARKLKNMSVRLQMAFVDNIGSPRATNPVSVPVSELLKEAGYDPA